MGYEPRLNTLVFLLLGGSRTEGAYSIPTPLLLFVSLEIVGF